MAIVFPVYRAALPNVCFHLMNLMRKNNLIEMHQYMNWKSRYQQNPETVYRELLSALKEVRVI